MDKPLTWKSVVLDGGTVTRHTLLIPTGPWTAEVWRQGGGMWSWEVRNSSAGNTLHPRGFGSEGDLDTARTKAETLVRNLLREDLQGPGKDLVRKTKIILNTPKENQ